MGNIGCITMTARKGLVVLCSVLNKAKHIKNLVL